MKARDPAAAGRGWSPGAWGSEDGAVAVLYSILMLLFIALIALALDLSALRFDRRNAQTAADLATTAAALQLLGDPDDPSVPSGPVEACERGWAYAIENTIGTNINDPGNQPPPCAEFATIACDPGSSTNTPHIVEGRAGAYVVQVVWPVADGSPLMEGRTDLNDGNECERISVTLGRERGFVFTGPFDYLAEISRAKAVARAEIDEGTRQAAALVVLDPHACNTLTSGGGGARGAIHVFEALGGGPGIIQVDSDGSGCGSGYIIDANGAPTEIKAGTFDDDGDADGSADDLNGDGRADVRNGAIYSFGLLARLCPTGTAANNWCAYESVDVTGDRVVGGATDRTPIAGERSTRSPWDWPYDCKSSYAFPEQTHVQIGPCPEFDPDDPTATTHITNLEDLVRPAIASGNPPAGFTVGSCDSADWGSPLARQNWWFDCDLSVGRGDTLTIEGGNVIITGKLDLKGTFRLNANGTTDQDNWLWLGGDFEKTSQATLRLGNPSLDPTGPNHAGTFVYIEPDNRINWAGGQQGSAEVTWISPYRGPFEDLGLWSEYNNITNRPHDLGGDVSNLRVDGIYYMPSARFLFRGSGEMKQQRAQFIAYRVQAQGNGALKMSPDPERSKLTHEVVVSLIR